MLLIMMYTASQTTANYQKTEVFASPVEEEFTSAKYTQHFVALLYYRNSELIASRNLVLLDLSI